MDLSTSLELSSEIHFILNPNMNIIACNSILTHLLQRSSNELHGSDFYEYLSENSYNETKLLINNLLPNKTSTFQVSLRKQDNTLINIVGKVRLKSNGNLHWVGNLQLRQASSPFAKFKRFFDMSLLDIMIIINKDGKTLLVNQGFADTLGYSTEDFKGKSVFKIFSRKTHFAVLRLAMNLLKNEGKTQKKVLECVCKDGKVKWLSWKAVFARENFYAVANDITEIKEKENSIQELLQTSNERNQALEDSQKALEHTLKKLKKRNYQLDQFVYRTSHDLRAPLSSILGLTNLAKIDIESKSDLVKYIDFIEKNILKLDEFVQALQDFTKSERTSIKIDLIDFKKIIKNANSSLRFINGYDSLSINLDIKGDNPFYSDIFRIDTVMNNLISNAIKYQNFRIDNSFLNISIDLTNTGSCHIIIEDNGIGIEEDYVDKIFDMFFRATEKGQGSGLGLYIVKQVLEKIRGTIEIESKFNVGTKITIHLKSLK